MIPVCDLRCQYHSIKREVDEAVARVLERGWFILGEEVAAFEAEFAAYCGASHAVGVASGTDALHLALRAVGVGPGDQVITVANAGVPQAAAIELAGARPVFVDVDPATYNMDPSLVEDAITPRTRAILPVHLYGHPADLDPILEIASRHGLAVVEDAAQAHGALYKGRRVGALGHIGIFSFYPTKNLGAYGDGGMVVTNDPPLAERVRLLRQYGWEKRYYSTLRGVNSRLDELQAAILRVKLRHLDEWNARRREIAARYDELLAGSGVVTPAEQPYAHHVYHLYVIRTPQRDALRAYLLEAGVGTSVHYPLPTHLQEAYRDLGLGPGSLPVTERAANEVLSLPMFPELTEEEQEEICQAIARFWEERSADESRRLG
ncbi:MAG TPA: DegT/DnrJ/EryC1/StrS family aminotransferase [Anaerolineae bacterium]|nr:DegT/DnrJ/EryC1/StrS family aminotransferase [Anaerolineae bacterium]